MHTRETGLDNSIFWLIVRGRQIRNHRLGVLGNGLDHANVFSLPFESSRPGLLEAYVPKSSPFQVLITRRPRHFVAPPNYRDTRPSEATRCR